MREIYIKSKAGLLPIGRRGENLATRVHLAEVPESGQYVTVFIKRNGDMVAYPASQVEVTDSEIIWTVNSTDTGKSGRGKVQYKFADSVTGEVIKTEIYGFVVGLAIDTEVGPAPDPYETWLDSLTDLAGQAQVSAREAEDYAESASESAEQAEASAESAEQSATQANTYATNAHTSATSATASEASARQSAISAEASAESAQASAGSAGASATAASASATSAGQSKDTAQTAAQTATTKASEASASATSAASSATTATTKAGEASQSATSAASSASTASTKASEASASATSASGSASTAATKASEASASATAAQEARTGAETAQASAESAAQTAQAGADAVGLLKEQIYNSYPNVEAEEGPIVSISDGAGGIPVKSLAVGIEPVQSGSGDPSPDNIRPITGWTGATVQRTGKNLLDVDRYGNILPRTTAGITWSKVGDGVYHAQGTATASSYFNVSFRQCVGDAMPCTSFIGRRLRLSTTDARVLFGIGYFREDGTYAGLSNGGIIPDDAVGLRAFVSVVGDTVIDTDFSVQLELGSTPTSYEPYSGTTYPITFPSSAGTVYGGSLDVTNGVLAVDRAQIASYNSETLPGEWISDRDVYVAGTTPTIGAQVVYELATPITYQLTPTEVATLLGSNAIWADTGDVQEMAYRADAKLYIDGVYEDYQDDLADYADALAALG